MAAQSRIVALLVAVLWVLGWAPTASVHGADEHASQHDCVDTPCRRTSGSTGDSADPDADDDELDAALLAPRASLHAPRLAAFGPRSRPRESSSPLPTLRAHRPRGPPPSPPINLWG